MLSLLNFYEDTANAYLKLDAGLGTLLLFGSVQLTMFTASMMMKVNIFIGAIRIPQLIGEN